ncbi:MAG TPA: DUF6600 domain-containing protein, partial [Stellaceae bacterium]|nr:DUF6600 domain-containing protein [Stellaceae bacterium]
DAGQPNGDQPADRVQVTVLEGAARFEGDRGAVEIGASEAAVISGDPMDIQLVEASSSDFDNWALARERREDVARQPVYIPTAVTGYQDLDQYGRWSPDPDYGRVWYPSDLPAGWAPYRDGHWAFVPPWGWTWIDDTPWGFAPFHYGRWIDRDDRWAWVPQDIPPQPIYAPALVAFVGGNGFGVDLVAGAAVAAVGWVALAPHEAYHPDYRASASYERNVNGRDWNTAGASGRNVTINNFRNRDATTVVPAAAFTNAAPVQRATLAVAPAQLARVRTTTALTSFHPSPLARIGRADPAAATVPQANAKATVARGRVAATTPASLGMQRVPTAPGPHRVAAAENHAPPTGRAVSATPAPTPQHAQNSPNQPAPSQPARTDKRAASAAPTAPAKAALAPHPVPPVAAATNAHSGTAQPGAPSPRPAIARPGAPVLPAPAVREAARPPQQRAAAPAPHTVIARPNAPTPPTAPHTAVAQPHAPAVPPPPARQAAALPHPPKPPARPIPPVIQVPHPQQQTHIAPTPQAWTHAPAPPPRPAPPAVHPVVAAPAPHPAAAAPAPHPAAPAPAAHPAPPAKAAPPTPDKKDQPAH